MIPEPPTVVDAIHAEAESVISFIAEHNEISFQNTVSSILGKNLLIAAASYLETILCDGILAFASSELSNTDHPLAHFVRNKAIKRQYATYFEWERANANQFFGLFGDAYKNRLTVRVREDHAFEDSVRAFLQLGSLRNQLVHQNFATFTLTLSVDEIHEIYRKADFFVATVLQELYTIATAAAPAVPDLD